MKSPLNYLGGKSRLADKIVTMMPDDHICYCEAFCGASWVLFAKPPSQCEVINDADNELVTFWRVIQNHLEEFLRYFKYAVTSRRIFDLENLKNPETLTDIQKAVRYYYLQRCGFGGKVSARTFGTGATGPARLNLSTIGGSDLAGYFQRVSDMKHGRAPQDDAARQTADNTRIIAENTRALKDLGVVKP
jgi:DNA adenine methylase